MDLVSQAELAVRLVNTTVRGDGVTLSPGAREAVRRLVADQPFLLGPLSTQDVASLLALRSELAAIFSAAAGGAEAAAVGRLNMLLANHPFRPVITRHTDHGWHVHLNDGGSVSDRYAAAAVAGLMSLVTEFGADRLGICAIAACDNVFIDASINRSRRYCAEHGAVGVHIAAMPAQRADSGRQRTAPAAS